jgi:hypothetical protein
MGTSSGVVVRQKGSHERAAQQAELRGGHSDERARTKRRQMTPAALALAATGAGRDEVAKRQR